MSLNSTDRVNIIEIAVRLHCASPTLDKSCGAVLDSAAAFAAFAEAESPPSKPARGGRPKSVPDVSDAPDTAAETVKETVKETVTPVKEAVKETVKEVVKETAPVVSEADVKAVVGKLVTNAAAGGAPKARAILAEFNATNISSLKPADYAKAHALMTAALKAAEEADVAA